MLHRSTEQWAANRSKGLSTAQPMRAQLAVSRSQSERALYRVMSRDRHVLHVMRQNCSSTLKTFWDYYKNDGWFTSVIKINLQDLIWLKFNHATADDMSYLVVKFQTDWQKKIFFGEFTKFANWTLVSLSRGARRARSARRVRASIQK